ncbi:MAG: ABC transporter ATP-binding protein [Tistlia sp.]|uniref:putative B6 ABC transporter ATP-binding protein n=1 Tax=Tistlia sp. TaxID=3057121 RepID=UPI0034A27F7C
MSKEDAGGAVAIALSGVTKRFPGVVANDRVSLSFRRGEVHALLGENGAGKSTLISILSGMQQPDEGEISVAGRPVRIASPRAALKLGIGTVYQHVLLIPSLTVLENLMLGGAWWRPLDRAATLTRFTELSALLSTRLDPDAPVGRLSLGEQQQLEIMRALWHGELVLILDEPTSMLTPQGVRELGAVVGRLRDHGVAVVFITHKLGEAYALADRITVLRLGRVVGELAPEQLRDATEQQVIEAVIGFMFGRDEQAAELEETLAGEAEAATRRSLDRSGPPALVLTGAATRGERGECPLREATLEVWPGEILGIAGVDGNGQKHLAEALAGQRAFAAGSMVLDGRDITGLEVVARRDAGVRYITDERLGEGTSAGHSVAANLVLKEIGRPPFWSRGLTRWGAIHGHARAQIQEHDVRTPSERTPIAKLSGGNIQKVLLARELDPEARLVIFNKPTYGLDLQNTKLARDRIRAGAGTRSAALVVISNELDELLEVCDRVAVMDGGRVKGTVENAPGAEAAIGRLMIGADAA